MYIERTLAKTIEKYLKNREIIAVVGPRQSGKTTLLTHFFEGLKNAIFLDFEDRKTLALFSTDIDSFIELYVKKYDYLFIDEFQYAKEGGKNLKYIYDHHNIKIIISGSSASELSIQGIKYLVGRVFVFNLHPLSFEEFLSYKDKELHSLYLKDSISSAIIERIKKHFDEFCIYGGYPKVVLADDSEEKQIVLRNIYNTYFLKEVKEIMNIPDDYKLSRLLNALALQIGNIVNYAELSALTNAPNKELLGSFNTLEKTFIIMRSTPFHTNKRTEIAKSPKIFLLDNGFRNGVINDFQPLQSRQDKGALYENFVASEILKAGLPVQYWRTKSKAEVDFIIKKGSNILPIEVKSGKPQPTKSLYSFMEKYKQKKAIILSEEECKNSENIVYLPIFAIGKELTKQKTKPHL